MSKKEIRENFRNEVFKRDNYKCVFCNKGVDLDAHHITNRNEMPNGGYVKENGITLCKEHHLQAEEVYWKIKIDPQFTPEALYKKINSNKELATKKSND